MKTTTLLFFWFLLLPLACLSAQQDSLPLPQDSIIRLDDSSSVAKLPRAKRQKGGHSVKKALLLACLVPGAGHVYNGKYWKLPIVYGGLVGLGYWAWGNNRRYRAYKNAYFIVLRDPSAQPNLGEFALPQGQIPNAATLNTLRREARTDYERSLLALVGFHALTIADAFVDAHLKTFDISDDLSMSIRPKIQLDYFPQPSASPNVALRFTARRQNKLSLPVEF